MDEPTLGWMLQHDRFELTMRSYKLPVATSILRRARTHASGELAGLTGAQNFTPLSCSYCGSISNESASQLCHPNFHLPKRPFWLSRRHMWVSLFFREVWLGLSHCVSTPYFPTLEFLPMETNTGLQPFGCYPVQASLGSPEGGLQWEQNGCRCWVGHLADDFMAPSIPEGL